MANVNSNDTLLALPSDQVQKLISLAIDHDLTVKIVEASDSYAIRDKLYELEYESSDEYYSSSC